MIEVIEQGSGVVELRLSRPPANLMDIVTLKALGTSLTSAFEDGRQGVILSGLPGVFSAGIDSVALLNSGESGTRAFCQEIFKLAAQMANSPIPIVTAITGHCIASGVLISIFSDYRVVASGNWRLALNEVKVGIALPECFQFALSRIVGSFFAERILVFGEELTPNQAKKIQLIDEIVPQHEVVLRAKEKLMELLMLPKHSMLRAREIARRDLAQAFPHPDQVAVEELVESFLHPLTRNIFDHLAENMKRKELVKISV